MLAKVVTGQKTPLSVCKVNSDKLKHLSRQSTGSLPS